MMAGPNVQKLIIHKVSVDAVPVGGGLTSALDFLTTPGRMAESFRTAAEWVRTKFALIRSAAEPNPWKHATDEQIAGEILRRIEEKKCGSGNTTT